MIGRGSAKAAKAPRRLRARPPGCAWEADVRVNRSGRFSWGICKVVGSRGESAKWSVLVGNLQSGRFAMCRFSKIIARVATISPQAQAWGLAAFSGRGRVVNLRARLIRLFDADDVDKIRGVGPGGDIAAGDGGEVGICGRFVAQAQARQTHAVFVDIMSIGAVSLNRCGDHNMLALVVYCVKRGDVGEYVDRLADRLAPRVEANHL